MRPSSLFGVDSIEVAARLVLTIGKPERHVPGRNQ
jgi:hypothetical protein